MERSCARAVELGLPSIAFTEHVDHTVWTVAPDDVPDDEEFAAMVGPDGHVTPPALDVSGYLASIERCRDLFPSLRILSGLELGEPHWHGTAVSRVLAAGEFHRVLGSLHCLPDVGGFAEPPRLFASRPPTQVVRDYLAEIPRLVAGSDTFAVLAHIDYPLRYWPQSAGRFEPSAFEEEFRHALRVTAQTGRALEINTVLPLHSTVLKWWREEGGDAVTFGSDAHEPAIVAHGFRDAADLAEAHGFRPGRDPLGVWSRAGR